MNRSRSRNIFIGLCLSPALILLIIFMVIPTIEVFRMSLFQWGGFSNNQEFIGLDNFKTLWNDMNFFRSFQNSILLIVIVSIFTLIFALFFAAVLTRENIK